MSVSTWPEGPSEESRFMALAGGGKNLLLTGSAGTGKSTLLKKYIESEQSRCVAVTASTGIAALNIHGTTLHRWAGFQLGAMPGEDFEEAAERVERTYPGVVQRAVRRMINTDVLVIDEISMLPGRQLDFLDFWLRRHRQRPNDVWGGLQILFVGDFLQLPPVRKNPAAPYDWAFLSDVWKSGAATHKTILLETVRRQDEPDLVAALQAVRTGGLTGRAAEVLMPRVLRNPPADRPRLLTHNAQVNTWCAYRLGDIDAPEVVHEATSTGREEEVEKLTHIILAPATLRIKKGAKVMNLVNRDCLSAGNHEVPVYVANGQIGYVIDPKASMVETKWEDGEKVSSRTVDAIIVEFERPDGTDLVYVTKFTWAYTTSPPPLGPSFTQFPLRLAYALTIHKSQSLSLEEAHCDIRAARDPGQAYVALSRVRTLSGLSLKEWPSGSYVSNEALRFYRQLEAPAWKPSESGRILSAPASQLVPPVENDSDDQIPFEFCAAQNT